MDGRRSITADTAMRLAHTFGTSGQMWMSLQTAYDLEVVAKKAASSRRRAMPASRCPAYQIRLDVLLLQMGLTAQ